MNTVIKGVIVGVCALGFAQIAMAKGPTASVTRGKNSKTVEVLVTLAQGEPHYRCEYSWMITFRGGAETSDGCEVDVVDGVKDSVGCSRRYDSPISLVTMTGESCKPQ